jgi:two-component system, NtrC family, sensor kinase
MEDLEPVPEPRTANPSMARGAADALAAFRAIIERVPGAWWIKDGNGAYLYANELTAGTLGVSTEGILGKTDFDLLPKETAELVRAHDAQVLVTGQSLEVVEQLPGPDGETSWWYSAKYLLPLGEQRCAGGFAIEATQLIGAKREAEGMLKQILNAITDMVLVKGPHSQLEWANQAFLSNYGMSIAELKGKIDAPFAEPDLTQQYVKDDLYVFTTGRSLEIAEEPLKRHDGKVLTCHTVKSPIFDARGKVIKTVAVIRDTTERKHLELELQQAQKLESVGRLASGIAHEINTPVQFVGDQTHFMRLAFAGVLELCNKYRAFVANVEQGCTTPEDIAAMRRAEDHPDMRFLFENIPDALEAIAEGTTRVADLVRSMKDFAHPDRGERSLADINRAIRNTLIISANEVKYVADVELDLGELPEVLCYASELNQVFLNLVVNAAHAISDVTKGTSARGKIAITTRHVEPDVIVSIADTGTGIPEELRSKIFDAFFTTKEVGKGTGQGLAIARMIVVEKHRGTLSFESQVGVGTTFHVRLPVAGASSSLSIPSESFS